RQCRGSLTSRRSFHRFSSFHQFHLRLCPFSSPASQACEGNTSPVPLLRLFNEASAACATCQPGNGSYVRQPWLECVFLHATGSCRPAPTSPASGGAESKSLESQPPMLRQQP